VHVFSSFEFRPASLLFVIWIPSYSSLLILLLTVLVFTDSPLIPAHT
jgi:hypothetical protein